MANYIVKKGDTLSKIASKYNTTVSAIHKANSFITDINKISAGMMIHIPENANYERIGKQFKACLEEIQNLDSFKDLNKMV